MERQDGWERFERAVDAAVKSGPHPREAKNVNQSRKKKQLPPIQVRDCDG